MRDVVRRISICVLLAGGLTEATRASAQASTAVLTPQQRLAREIYKELVEINTVDSVGSVTQAAEAMARRFRAAGFPAADVQVLVPPGKPTKGNLVVRYRGRGGPNAPRPILLLAHLDVVAAKREDWKYDPFVLREENGYFLGRGTADDKAMAAVFVANLLRYRQEGWVPTRDIILALTADEESGDGNGAAYLSETHRDLIDAAYAINEGSDEARGPDGKPLYLGLQAAEKLAVNYTLTATNPGGHSSQPRPDNAIYQLAHALERLEAYTFPVALNPVSRAYLEQTAKVESPAMAAAMRTVLTNPTDAAALSVLSQSVTYRTAIRTTCVATRLEGGHAYNALPQRASANVNCRVVPTSTPDEVRDQIARVVGDTGVKVVFTFPRSSYDSGPRRPVDPVDPELLSAVTSISKSMWGNVPVIPMMSMWATDGAILRQAGIPTFGVSGMFLKPGEDNSHGLDEKMPVKSFYEGLEFLDRLVRTVSGGGGAPKS
ncbi:MAG TPA: M20/M25/M40 family metallo-hydrolase [Gemmatimonadaceae bacterium]|nr:M20/M25/M40 family metallo-hydrolase [Gemmatimonadaceae bacterium]